MKAILAPIDFSSVSDAVVAQAGAFARAFDGHVILLNVIEPPVITSEYAPLIDNLAEITAAGEKNAARRLAAMQEKLQQEGVRNEAIQLVGSPIAHIAEQAQKLDADYIVMGSHGHTALYDLLVGSTTHGVLLRAKCPVMIVPAEKRIKAPVQKKVLHAFA